MSRVRYVVLCVLGTNCRKATDSTMPDAYKLDCESEANDCRFIIQSENETEAIDLAKSHMQEDHGQEYSGDELREQHLQEV